MQKIHLDTDLGGDIDDLCALAMLLRWPEVEISGITTVGELGGRRAGYARYACRLAGKPDIPVAAGAENSPEFYRYPLGLPEEERYWPEPVDPAPNPLGEALSLLKKSIEAGAILAGIGPYTNLYLLDRQYPGILQQARLFLMGGYAYPPRPGFPAWGNEMDFNVQVDVRSAKHVLENSRPVLVPLSVTVETALRRADLDGIRQAGALGQLIARQAEAFAEDERMETRFGTIYPGLPDDLINFHHDPLACAIALGWREGVEIEEMSLVLEEKEEWLREIPHPAGKTYPVVTKIDGSRFNNFWAKVITHTPGCPLSSG